MTGGVDGGLGSFFGATGTFFSSGSGGYMGNSAGGAFAFLFSAAFSRCLYRFFLAPALDFLLLHSSPILFKLISFSSVEATA